jgi:hypothetical protein
MISRSVPLLATAALAPACASINPTLAPARVLPAERIAVDLGSAYAAPLTAPALRDALDAAARLANGTGSDADRAALARGALAHGNTPPGVGSHMVARVGLGQRAEGHVGLLGGRTVRVGARRVFWTDPEEEFAFSLGVQARGAFYTAAIDSAVPGLVVPEGRLFGGDVAAVFGRTSSELYDLWVGLRAGYTYGSAQMALASVNGGLPFEATLHRFDAALTLGLRVGFGRVAAMAELETDFGYYWTASAPGFSSAGATLSLVPAAALSYGF